MKYFLTREINKWFQYPPPLVTDVWVISTYHLQADGYQQAAGIHLWNVVVFMCDIWHHGW